jgi:hypothetical protein
VIHPNDDGIGHINVYSKAKTELGRYLSNFSDCYVETEDGKFRTIEGYWYWLSCKHEPLRDLPGWQCKEVGRDHRGEDWPKIPGFEQKIMKAIMTKMQHPWCVEELKKTGSKPFFHYYVFMNRAFMVKDGLWIITLITEFRDELVKIGF